MKRFLPFILVLIVAMLVYAIVSPTLYRNHAEVMHADLEHFADVIDLQQLPLEATDRSAFCFSDKGAWHGYGLVPDSLNRLGFTGPFIMGIENGYWLSQQLIQFHRENEAVPDVTSHAYPGYLKQIATWEDLEYTATLHFVDSLTALLLVEWVNMADRATELRFRAKSVLFSDFEQELLPDGSGLICKGAGEVELRVQGPADLKWQIADNKASAEFNRILEANGVLQHVWTFSLDSAAGSERWDALTAQGSFTDNHELWQERVRRVLPEGDDAQAQRLAVKSMETLVTNWRHARGNLPYAGLFPSYNYRWFNGFWAWDSWKHSVALAPVLPKLAKNQIRTLAVWQDSCGMIPDVIYADSIENNWRNTKPPLMGWAVWQIFTHTRDTAFVREMLPYLEKYHAWWYTHRDVDNDGLCEYGATDGTLIAAKWESGMDNAVRFDSSRLIQNNEHSWSLNQESVDLNAYLAAEKGYLSQLAEVTGQIAKADAYANEKAQLQQQVLDNFWHEADGYFYDKTIDGNDFIRVRGPEGWIPLWAGLATPDQAKRVLNSITDTTRFATYVPFPTVDYSNPGFAPSRGYWRGPVWVDQVWFALKGLRNYGFDEQADELQQKFLTHAEGVYTAQPLRENYHPLTGEGLNANHFSWTAAHILMMLHEE
jgi:putative isomerase